MYEYVLQIVDVLLMKDHHQMLAKETKIRKKNHRDENKFFFTRRRINSSGRNICDEDEDVIVSDRSYAEYVNIICHLKKSKRKILTVIR